MTSPHKLLKTHGFYAKKELGQNFLSDPSSPETIIRKAGIEKGCNIVEIGPGLGALTLAASEYAQQVFAIEKDTRLIPILKSEIELYRRENIDIINNDILKTDISPFLSNDINYLIGNLPYNISSQIIFKAVDHKQKIKKCIFMLQKELAQRIVSSHGSKEYGRISAVLQYHSSIKTIANLGPGLFYPRPKVDSSVIEIDFSGGSSLKAENEKLFHDVVRVSFSQRRKTMKNSLGKAVKDKELLEEIFSEAKIPLGARAETIDVEGFVRLSNIFHTNKISI